MRRQSINIGQRLSPSARKIIKLRQRAFNSGGASLELQIPTNYIRDISRKLNYDITSDASFIMVPNTIGEGRLFNAVPILNNLLIRSEEIDNAIWAKTASTVSPNITTAPDGNTTVDKVIATTQNTFNHAVSQTIGKKNSYFTFSVYLKAAELSNAMIQLADLVSDSTQCSINLISGTISIPNTNNGTSFTNASSNIVNIGGGWFRCSITALRSNNQTNTIPTVYVCNSTYTSFAGNGTDGLYIWGGQLESGNIATTYQRTTDGIIDFQATRATTANITRKDGTIGDGNYNVLTFSEDYTQSIWTKVNATITSNAIANPFGLSIASKINETAVNGFHSITLTTSLGLTGTYNASVYAKKAERDFIFVQIGNSSGTYFNLNTGVIGSSVGGSVGTMVDVGNGWYRCSVKVTNPTVDTRCTLLLANVDGAGQYLGTTGFGVYIWGAQFVQGSQPKDYLKTTNRLAVPSIDYSLGSSLPALLVEPLSSNILLWSEDYSQPSWNKSNSTIVSNATIAPNGQNTACKLVEDTANAIHFINRSVSVTNATVYTISGYAKAAQRTKVRIVGTPNSAIIDLTNGNVISSDFISIKVEPYNNGWYRISASYTSTSTSTIFYFELVNPSNSITYIGDGVSGLYIWGGQLEQGSIVSSYMPTTTAAVTRNAYTSYVDLWNNSLLNSSNATLYIEGVLYNGGGATRMIALADTTTGGVNDLAFFDGLKASYAVSSTITSDTSNLSTGTAFKAVIQRNGTSVKWFRNGIQLWATQTIAVADYRYLIVNNGGSTYCLKKIILWRHTKSDSDCILLTT